ncbi:MAG: YggS family pyridoxal phosphate-dependent enzyme [Endomicrobium sp.]|jgi:pyridoxal phosphate enzyme (YggS family)|nr:YggS family pyridoxal phosphate-dependent enzyme [Endomicrobium sp.]
MKCKNIRENVILIKKTLDSIRETSNIVELVAITKNVSYECILEALKCGIKHIGESKIQEALPKFKQLDSMATNVVKHFVGHLQSNKAKKAVENFDLIQSLDSIDLALILDRYARKIGKVQDCLIEIKVDEKVTKTGINPRDIKYFYKRCLSISNISIKGLMVVAPYSNNFEDSRQHFKHTYNLFKDVKKSFSNPKFTVLSMGMSGDYTIAVKEGANMIRLGSAIF